MRRRTLLRVLLSTFPTLPLTRVRLGAQARELTPEAMATLREIGETALPASLGAERISAIVDRFVVWMREYEEGIALAHGYGHPRLVKSPASPVPDYGAQLATLDAAARRAGGGFGTLPLETRRRLLSDALTAAGVEALPGRPAGRHVASDLMAFYFRSSEANDVAYQSRIGRQVCRPIDLTTRRPAPLA